MHERALMADVIGMVEAVAREHDAVRVTRVSVRLGTLSHFTPGHFREHFVYAARATLAQGAEVDAVIDAEAGTGVLLESIEVER